MRELSEKELELISGGFNEGSYNEGQKWGASARKALETVLMFLSFK